MVQPLVSHNDCFVGLLYSKTCCLINLYIDSYIYIHLHTYLGGVDFDDTFLQVDPRVESAVISTTMDDILEDEECFQVTLTPPNTPNTCLLYTSPSPRDRQKSRMPSSA